MAESILTNITQEIIVQLVKDAVQEIASPWHVESKLETLQATITAIKGALANAEKQQPEDQLVRNLLERLEDAVYEADDLADEFSTEALRRQVITAGNNKMAKKVRTFFSSSNQLVFRYKMSRKIKDIRNKLEGVVADKRFQFETISLRDTNKVVPVEWEHSFVGKDEVIGRDDEKMAIIKLLFDIKIEENIGVLPIVGVGGLGKTTLAKLVLNDEVVKQQFELRMWVSVPKVFDVQVIVKDIINKSGVKNETSVENYSMDELQKKLRENINGKRYFLVLDDLWEESRENWLKLENLLKTGGDGSRIIVTTRNKTVADIVESATMEAYHLGTLSDAKSWDLFKKKAFKQGKEPEENILKIGVEILKKCGGNPLVIATIGSMLYSMDPEEWSLFNEKEMLSVSKYEDDIIPRLKLSYDRLPSHLKRCFAYCSLFPKNYEIDVQQLIKLWMAQGFIKLSDSHQRLEEIGYQNFKALLRRSFFQEVEFDDFSNNVKICTMHDCMHDLAKSIAGTRNVVLSLDDANNKIDKRTFHVSFDFFPTTRDLVQKFSTSADHATRIRTIFCASYYNFNEERQSIDGLFDFGLEFLRSLDLHDSNLKTLPNSIGNMKHLRYLDLSGNGEIESLPDSITRLVNLQTLDLSQCTSLLALPGGIAKLVNLRHLDLSGNREIESLPDSIAGLVNLQTLDLSRCTSLRALPGGITKLVNLRHLDLSGITKIESLSDSITRLVNLQTLDLSRCTSLRALPGGITKLVNLRHLRTSECYGLTHMPRGIGQLTNLQTLSRFVVDNDTTASRQPIGELNELENLNNLRGQLEIVVKKEGIESKAANLKNKQNLHVLKLQIEGTIVDNGEGFLPHSNLKDLNLKGDHIHLCVPLLKCVPSLRSLVRFSLMNHKECQCPPPLNHLPCLKVLHLSNLPALEYISSNNDKNCFSSLEQLKLHGMPNLKGWWKLDVMDIESNASLAGNITTIPFFPCLSTLYIGDCPKLISMPLYPYLELLALANTSLNSFEQTSMMINEGGQTSNQASSSISTSSTHLASDIQPLSKLETMRIKNVELQCLSDQGFKSLASLKVLWIVKCGPLQSLSPGIQHLTSLQELAIQDCEQLDMSDAAMWRNLGSLRTLCLSRLPQLVALPEGLQQLTTLQRIQIWECNDMVDIMECISGLKSLERLEIVECLSLRSLPEGIDCLPSLQTLEIKSCPILLERCRKDTGDYWPKICNIKELDLDPSPEGTQQVQNFVNSSQCWKHISTRPGSIPPKGWIKVNTDASHKQNGLAMVVRDEVGKLLFSNMQVKVVNEVVDVSDPICWETRSKVRDSAGVNYKVVRNANMRLLPLYYASCCLWGGGL
ncbi:hypothetical protein FNV43_RR20864 [Rhamnella rubrinervis]|uniref:Uncharacterized protein n=1 Tax=Rhamnella rubrinervis TaxID=2594499 RepID=A0A8K0E155_9ROSA|nr:hypothetical protein FNV43_RR20864 [Rhamnella rubrinervis]